MTKCPKPIDLKEFIQSSVYTEENQMPANTLWLRRQSEDMPPSVQAGSLDEFLTGFFQKGMPPIKCIHSADEVDHVAHQGLHIGEGSID